VNSVSEEADFHRLCHIPTTVCGTSLGCARKIGQEMPQTMNFVSEAATLFNLQQRHTQQIQSSLFVDRHRESSRYR